MTRTYALRRLLEHGPMNRAELLACTRWPRRELGRALQAVVDSGVVVRRRVAASSRRDSAFEFEAVK